MKTLNFFILLLILFPALAGNAQVIISNGAKSNAHPSAILELKSDSLGLLIPRTSTARRISIPNPAEGLVIYDHDEKKIFIFNGARWMPLLSFEAAPVNSTETTGGHSHEIREIGGLTEELANRVSYRKRSVSCEIDFSVPKIFGSATNPCNNNINTIDSNAREGIVQKIYHMAETAPEMPATWVLTNDGKYIAGRLNIIYAEWVDSGRVEYSIFQSSDKLAKSAYLSIDSIEEESIRLSWAKIPLAAEYILERSFTANFENSIEIFRGKSLEFKDVNLEPNTLYYYRVTGSAPGWANSPSKSAEAKTKEKEDNSLLRKFPGASAAYALVKLNSAYNGFAIQVRRATDNALRDIGFSKDELDEKSLEEFSGGADLFVRIIYDQGGQFNLLQTADTMQPKIVEQGKIIKYLNKPAIRFDAAKNNFLTAAGYVNPTGIASVFQVVSNWQIGAILTLNETDLNDAMMTFIGTVNGTINNRYRRSTAVVGMKTDLRHCFVTNIFNGSQFSVFINKVLQGTPQNLSPLVIKSGFYRLGARSSGVSKGTFQWQGSVVYQSDQTANRLEIESLLEKRYNQDISFNRSSITLPDGSGTQPGKGFTITGIAIDRAETALRNDGRIVIWASNHGENQEPVYNSNIFPDQRASIVKLLLPPQGAANLEMATKLDELMIWQNPGFTSKGSIQGICTDNNNTLWFTDNMNLYNFTKQGAFIRKFDIRCNGVAYDEKNNQLILSAADGEVTFVNPENGLKIGESLKFGISIDQITYDSKNEIIYGSTGASALVLRAMQKNGVAVQTPFMGADRTYAPEGIAIYDKYLFSASDAWYHPKTPLNEYSQLNAIHVYRLY